MWKTEVGPNRRPGRPPRKRQRRQTLQGSGDKHYKGRLAAPRQDPSRQRQTLDSHSSTDLTSLVSEQGRGHSSTPYFSSGRPDSFSARQPPSSETTLV